MWKKRKLHVPCWQYQNSLVLSPQRFANAGARLEKVTLVNGSKQSTTCFIWEKRLGAFQELQNQLTFTPLCWGGWRVSPKLNDSPCLPLLWIGMLVEENFLGISASTLYCYWCFCFGLLVCWKISESIEKLKHPHQWVLFLSAVGARQRAQVKSISAVFKAEGLGPQWLSHPSLLIRLWPAMLSNFSLCGHESQFIRNTVMRAALLETQLNSLITHGNEISVIFFSLLMIVYSWWEGEKRMKGSSHLYIARVAR